jgi:hypothetical protein
VGCPPPFPEASNRGDTGFSPPLIVIAAATASGPLAAQFYADAASGLAVDPPKPFAAKPGRPQRQFDVAIDVASTTDKRLCTIGSRFWLTRLFHGRRRECFTAQMRAQQHGGVTPARVADELKGRGKVRPALTEFGEMYARAYLRKK